MDNEAFFLAVTTLARALTGGVIAGLSFWACRTIGRSERWWFYFSANGALYSLLSISVVMMLGMIAAEPIAFVLAIVLGIAGAIIFIAWMISVPWAVAGDLWHQERRDALHWTGVAVLVVGVLAVLAIYVPVGFW